MHGVHAAGGLRRPSDIQIPSTWLSPEVVLWQDGIVLGQVRVEVARVQVLVRLAAVEQFLRGFAF